MNWVNTVWPMISAGSLTVAAIYFLVWMRAPGRASHLLIGIAAASVSAVGLIELAAMQAEHPTRYEQMIRWAHVPVAIAAVCVVGFVRLHYGVGNLGLALVAIATRIACLVPNFFSGANLNYGRVHSLGSVKFLGSDVSVPGVAEPNPWMLLGSANALLIVVFLGHAILQLARRLPSPDRTRAITTCTAILVFALMAGLWTWMIVHGHVDAPHLFAPAFLGVLLAASYELAGGFTAAGRLARSLTIATDDLRDTRRRMGQAADAAGVGFWNWDVASGRIWLSHHASALLGVFSRERLASTDFLARLPQPDRNAFLAGIAASTEEEEFRCEFRVAVAEGRYRWIAARAGVIPDDGGKRSLDGVLVDITDRKESESRFRLVVEAASGAQVVVAPTGQVVLANQGAAAIFGCSLDELVGTDFRTLVPAGVRGSDATRAGDEWPSVGTMGKGVEVVGRRKGDGGPVPLTAMFNAVPFESDLFLLVSLMDLSEKKRAEYEEALQRDEIAHLSRVALLATLSGSLAHELNQPLAAILANAQAARRFLDCQAPDLDEVRESLAAIAENDMRAAELIKRMRALLRKDNSGFRTFAMGEAVDEVLRLLRGDLLIRQVDVAVETQQPLPLVRGDSIQIQQVVLNLLMNACDAMADQPSPRRILVRVERAGDFIRVAVTDQGSGIAAEDLKRIFSPFHTSKRDGLGLGLAVCNTIIMAHDGDIVAESDGAGRGATVSFRLPFIGA